VSEGGMVVWEAPDRPAIHHPEASLIVFTSGSTGQPRAVQISRMHLERNAANCIEMVGMRQAHEQILFAPISHVLGLFGHLLPGLKAGLTTHLYSSLVEVRGVIERGKARGILSGVPSHWEALIRYCSSDPALYQHVTQLVSSGAPLHAGLRRRMSGRFPAATILNGYGLTEAPRILALSSDHPRFFSDATGLPTPGAELSILANGELCVRGPLVMLGYLGAPSPPDQRMSDGWLPTGDIATADPDGIFTVFGRLDDMRNVGGERISLTEIDHQLVSLAGVADAGTTVEPDDVYGERLIALLVGDPTLARRSRAEIRDELARLIAWHKVPARFYLVESLPRNRVGKLQRADLLGLCKTAYELL
jgi:long-chain acyl-CoA synthetase